VTCSFTEEKTRWRRFREFRNTDIEKNSHCRDFTDKLKQQHYTLKKVEHVKKKHTRSSFKGLFLFCFLIICLW